MFAWIVITTVTVYGSGYFWEGTTPPSTAMARTFSTDAGLNQYVTELTPDQLAASHIYKGLQYEIRVRHTVNKKPYGIPIKVRP